MSTGIKIHPDHSIHQEHRHFYWDNSLDPVVRVEPGAEIEFSIVDASDGQLNRSSRVEDVKNLDFSRVNPVTGPVYVEGAERGDALSVEILDFKGDGWGWTAIIPGFGLLAEDFTKPFLHISRYNEQYVEFTPELHLPMVPFPGTIGVAPAATGRHSVIPPRQVGGNMDIRDLSRGTKLYLPVEVPGALFSVGDTHAAQGDGEVCGTAIETPMQIRLRFDLVKGANLKRPQFETKKLASHYYDGTVGYYVTTGVASDLIQATKDAVRDMIEHLGHEYKLPADLAYALCSVAVDMRISEVVDTPNWVVSAYLPKGIFV